MVSLGDEIKRREAQLIASAAGGVKLSNVDTILHYLYIRSVERNYYSTMYDDTLAKAIAEFPEGIEGSVYKFDVVYNRSYEALDNARFFVELQKAGVSHEILKAAQKKSMVTRKGARRIYVKKIVPDTVPVATIDLPPLNNENKGA